MAGYATAGIRFGRYALFDEIAREDWVVDALGPRAQSIRKRLAPTVTRCGDRPVPHPKVRMGARTVEQHVAAVMARAKVDERLRRAAKFWRG